MRIDWAREHMPVLGTVREQLLEEGSVRGRRIAVVEPSLAAMLVEAGAEVVADDDLLRRRPEVVIDRRAELVRLAHTTRAEALHDLIGAVEGTASGVLTLRAMEADGTLSVPVIAAGDARCSRDDSGQAIVMAVADSTNLLLSGKRLVVVGYGRTGRGIARSAHGMNAQVIVSEVDPFAALDAHRDGFDVLPVEEACAVADVVVTATRDELPLGAIERLPDGALLAGAGPQLRERALETRRVREQVEELVLEEGRSVFVLDAAAGAPVEVVDLTLSVQALAARHLLLHGADLDPRVHPLPAEIDESVARRKLGVLGRRIDEPTGAEQADA